MIIELLSLALSAVQVFQGLKGARSDRERLSALCEGLVKANGIHVFATDAKAVHNQFQLLQSFILKKFGTLDDPDEVLKKWSSTKKAKVTREILRDADSLIERSVKDFPELTVATAPAVPSGVTPPAQVAVVLRSFGDKYRELRNALLQYEENKARVEAFCNAKDFGKDYQEAMHFLFDSIVRSLNIADQLLRDVIPLIAWVHSEAIASLKGST